MAQNDLRKSVGRVGRFIDGNAATPEVAALLLDDGERITLTVSWRDDDTHEVYERKFSGRSVRFGDDPDYSKFEYSLPGCAWFQDVEGVVALVGCRSNGVQRGFASGMSQGVADVRFAVLGGRSNYASINGLRSELPGLGEWIGVSSIAEKATFDDDRRLRSVDVRLDSPKSIVLARSLNLTLQPSFRVDRAHEIDALSLRDAVQIETLVQRPRDWIEHLQAHNTLRDLVRVAGWTSMPWGEQWAHRADDPERTLSGREIGPLWAKVRSYDLRPAVEGRGVRPTFLFSFDDVGTDGYRRWHRLRRKFKRGMDSLVPLAGAQRGFIETSIAQSGIGLEALGYVLAQDAGLSESLAAREPHADRLERIASSIPSTLVPDLATWPARSTDAYNGVKHADRDMPDFLEMLNIQRENCLIFRLWVARRIGVSIETLQARVRADRLSRPFISD